MFLRCPIGQKEVPEPNVCENIDECLDNPCYNGICKDNLNGFVCECHPGWAGELCDIKTDAVVAYIGKGAILAIVISCLVLLGKYIFYYLSYSLFFYVLDKHCTIVSAM